MATQSLNTTSSVIDFLETMANAMFEADEDGSPKLSSTGHEVLKALAGGTVTGHNTTTYNTHVSDLESAANDHYNDHQDFIP